MVGIIVCRSVTHAEVSGFVKINLFPVILGRLR